MHTLSSPYMRYENCAGRQRPLIFCKLKLARLFRTLDKFHKFAGKNQIKSKFCQFSERSSFYDINTYFSPKEPLFVIFYLTKYFFKNQGHTPASVLYESSPPGMMHYHPIKTNNSNVIRHLQQIMAMTLSK